MTEIGYTSEQTFRGASNNNERLVFVDPADPHGREFHITPEQQVIGSDSPEVNEAIEAARRDAEIARNEAAASTPESGSSAAELGQAINWNGIAVVNTRDHAEKNGL